ncbi:MAG: cyclic nucleotide-binding domain-containing protein [Acidimicrobiia bacterium]
MSKIDPKLARLKASNTFAHLGDRRLKALAPFTDDVDVAAGTTLMEEGSLPHELEVLVSGTADVLVGGKKVGELGPGDVIGEMALLNRTKRSATVVTTSPARLIVISSRAFAGLVEKFPEVAEDLRNMADARARRNSESSD